MTPPDQPIRQYARKRETFGRGHNASTVLTQETLEGVRLHMKMHRFESMSGAIHDLVRRGLGLPPLC
jgi:hypothetical protein